MDTTLIDLLVLLSTHLQATTPLEAHSRGTAGTVPRPSAESTPVQMPLTAPNSPLTPGPLHSQPHLWSVLISSQVFSKKVA